MKRYLIIRLFLSIVMAVIPLSIAHASPSIASCKDQAAFISDVSIPDDTRIEAGKSFEKIWKLKNSGTCTWSTSYALVFVKGHKLGGPDSIALPQSVRPGETAELKIPLTAPTSDGTYRGNWKLRNAGGNVFGLGDKSDQLFWVQIIVGKSNPSSPTQTPSPSIGSWKGEYFANPNLAGSPKFVRTDAKIDFNWKLTSPASNMPKDDFSVRWTATHEFETGIYRFKLYADDKASLKVGDRLVLRVTNSGSPEQTYDLALLKGRHQLVLTYHEYTGNARVWLKWEKISLSTFSDWKGEYWSNYELNGNPVAIRNDKAIDFRWREKAPVLGMPKDDFSARWTRTINFQNGFYRFNATADEGVRVYIDGKRIIDEWHSSDGKTICTYETQINGSHTIVVEYYDRAGNASVKFWWELIPVTPTPTPTIPPQPQIIYSFAERACEAEWRSEAGNLLCPGAVDDSNGYVLRLENPALENGVIETRPTLLTHPQAIENGYIQGTFPAIAVQAGDHFQATIGCGMDAAACDVIFQLNYRIGDSESQTLTSWRETHDGQTRTIDVDLSPLAGKSVRFLLTVLANGQPTQDRALWVLPRLIR